MPAAAMRGLAAIGACAGAEVARMVSAREGEASAGTVQWLLCVRCAEEATG